MQYSVPRVDEVWKDRAAPKLDLKWCFHCTSSKNDFFKKHSLRLGADADVLLICLQNFWTTTLFKQAVDWGNRTFGTCSGYVIL